MSLRNVIWPPLIFVGVVGAAQFASYGQSYVHSDKTLLINEVQYVGPALIWALVAVLCVIFALALLVFHGRVVENTLRFAGLIGFIGLLTLWIYSLALWSFNQLLLKTNASSRHPFDPPSWNSAISLGALLIFGIIYVARRLRTPSGKPQPS
jgi:amino acid transporter